MQLLIKCFQYVFIHLIWSNHYAFHFIIHIFFPMKLTIKQIYKGATDEQRMAMMKSFEESGGTVLSTNWEEVSKEKVKGSAPNGMVMKSWSEIHHGKKEDEK